VHPPCSAGAVIECALCWHLQPRIGGTGTSIPWKSSRILCKRTRPIIRRKRRRSKPPHRRPTISSLTSSARAVATSFRRAHKHRLAVRTLSLPTHLTRRQALSIIFDRALVMLCWYFHDHVLVCMRACMCVCAGRSFARKLLQHSSLPSIQVTTTMTRSFLPIYSRSAD
jgi:hypothetical protein